MDEKKPDGNTDTAVGTSKKASAISSSSSEQPSSAGGKAGRQTEKVRKPRVTLAVVIIVLLVIGAGAALIWPRYSDQIAPFLPEGWLSDTVLRPEQSSTQPASETAPAEAVKVGGSSSPTSLPVSALNALTARLEGEIEARQALGETVEARLAEMQRALDSSRERLRQLSTTSREDWLLAEAEYLLRLANQRILTERQTANALSLMTSADEILRDINDPSLFAVRQSIADDITALRMSGTVDREGLFLRIGSLISSVDRLSVPAPRVEPKTAVDPIDYSDRTWLERLGDNARLAFEKMFSFVRIERRDLPLKSMLTESQEAVIRDSVRLLLEQARLALLREQQVVYQQSLDRAAALVKEHFMDDQVASVFIEELHELDTVSVRQSLPSLTGSIRALQDYIHLWHNRYEPEGQSRAAREPDSAEVVP